MENLSGVLDMRYFDSNLKSLNNQYETYVLSVGEFDERIFLGEKRIVNMFKLIYQENYRHICVMNNFKHAYNGKFYECQGGCITLLYLAIKKLTNFLKKKIALHCCSDSLG